MPLSLALRVRRKQRNYLGKPVNIFFSQTKFILCLLDSAYIVPLRPLSSQEISSFAAGVQDWTSQRVAPHKRLRGGIVIIDNVPKRSGTLYAVA